jgi:hypothetical protein
MTQAIFAPLFAYTLWLFVLWMLLGGSRGLAWIRGAMPPEYFRVGLGPRPGDRIVDIHHHFSNQFEIPVLFYLGCLTAVVSNAADERVVSLAWAFVGLRVIHSTLVLIKNDPRTRLWPYALSAFCVWALWASLFAAVFRPSA